jgi:lipid II:glycine glycyltransferase (peptidoglycan interpeptide bridge formation enzyme)
MMRIDFQAAGYRFRFFDRFDEETRRFEEGLRSGHSHVESIPWPRISFWQGYRHLQSLSGRYFVLQMLREDSNRAYQIAAIEHPSRIRSFTRGLITHWIPACEPEASLDQAELLRRMTELCRRHTSLMSLRVHCYVPGDSALDAAERLLEEQGFEPCQRQTPAKTRIIDLRPSLEEILSQFSKKTRPKLRIRKPEEVWIAELTSREHIPALQTAVNDAFQRTTHQHHNYDFASLFNTLEDFPETAVALGFFVSEEPRVPKAFVAGVASGPLFAYIGAGSRSDPRLRRHPFNQNLLWRLLEIAKARGALLFDMGGITDGGPDDPLAGISDFKRHFPGFELSIGRERLIKLRPMRHRVFSVLHALTRRPGVE